MYVCIFVCIRPNVLTPPPSLPKWLLFLFQFTNLLMVLLEITATACFIIWLVDMSTWPNLYIAVLLFVVIFLTCYEMYSQEAKVSTGKASRLSRLVSNEWLPNRSAWRRVTL